MRIKATHTKFHNFPKEMFDEGKIQAKHLHLRSMLVQCMMYDYFFVVVVVEANFHSSAKIFGIEFSLIEEDTRIAKHVEKDSFRVQMCNEKDTEHRAH